MPFKDWSVFSQKFSQNFKSLSIFKENYHKIKYIFVSNGNGLCKQFFHSRMMMICLGSGAKLEEKNIDMKQWYENSFQFVGGTGKSLFKRKKQQSNDHSDGKISSFFVHILR